MSDSETPMGESRQEFKSVDMPKWLYDKVEEACAEQGCSQSDIVIPAIEQELWLRMGWKPKDKKRQLSDRGLFECNPNKDLLSGKARGGDSHD